MNKIYNIHTIWMAMILLTLSTYSIGKLGYTGASVVFFLLFTTIVKGVLIIREFMELRGVSLLWRIIMYGWLWITCIAIGISYIISLQS